MRYVAFSLPNKNVLSLTLIAGSSLLGLGACGKLPGFAVDAKVEDFDQLATINNKIDILFVVDNSGSMADEQTNLAESFSDFITKFGDRKLDFQVGVISTDVTAATQTTYWNGSSGTSPYKTLANGGPGTLLSFKSGTVTNPKFVTPNTPNYVDIFKQNVKLGIGGSGAEAGLLSSLTALAPAMLATGGYNAGFVRDDALLSVIYVSDEDESRGSGSNSTWYLRTVQTDADARVAQVKTLLTTLKPDANHLRVDAIVAPSQAECSTVGDDGHGLKGIGLTYINLVTQMGGETHNICRNFSDDILKIGGDLLTLLTRFKLLQKPDGQIEVSVNGVVVPRDATNGWDYLPDTNEVEFRGDAVPAADAKIAVKYVPGEPLQ